MSLSCRILEVCTIPLHAGIKAHLVALVAWRVLPPKQLQKVAFVAPPIPTKDMKSPRPKRLRRDRVPWKAAVAFTLSAAKKAEQKAPRTSKIEALKPIPLEPLPSSIERPLPYYTPQLNIRKKLGRPTFSNISPIETFKRFICVIIIRLIVLNINAYAERQRAEDILNQLPLART
jgi:hypothetical protein